MEDSHFNRIVLEIIERMPAHARFLRNTLPMLDEVELTEADAYCVYLLGKYDLDFIVEAYRTVVIDTLEAQIEFFRNKKYRHSTFAEVARSVYFHPSYMNHYMVGLALTTFLWPNHIEIYRFFRQTLPRPSGGCYLEIGPGHGFFFLHAIRYGTFERFIGVDLSPSSIALTKDVVLNLAPERRNNCNFIEMDFLTANKLRPPFAAIIMGEVLEHVERPALFLQKIASLASSDSYIFITTCVNAPAIDHIYLFRKVSEIDTLISNCGLKIHASKVIPYQGKTLEQSVAGEFPINVAYILGL